jgi:hypothetical protein
MEYVESGEDMSDLTQAEVASVAKGITPVVIKGGEGAGVEVTPEIRQLFTKVLEGTKNG